MAGMDDLRRPLPSGPTRNVAASLKQWRADQGFTQTEAAAHLGVSVRTLQGWEAGRPMPYPSLLRQPVNIAVRAPGSASLSRSQFSRELASFVDFVGPADIDKAITKVRQRLDALSPAVRGLYGDRFYLHEQWEALREPPGEFDLDLQALRAATLITAINRACDLLSEAGRNGLRSIVLDNLQPARDVRRMEHQIHCYAHFVRKGYPTTFADPRGDESFDLLVDTPSGPVEVECKTVTEDTGSQLKTDMTADLCETFRASVLRNPPADEAGLFVLKFRKPAEECKHLGRKLRQGLEALREGIRLEDGALSLKFVPKPDWQAMFEAHRFDEFGPAMAADALLASNPHCIVRAGSVVLGLVLVPHKPTVMADRMVKIFQKAARQCSGDRPALLWLHILGFAERQFVTVARFAADDGTGGLDAIVANALQPKAGTGHRTHVERIRFSLAPNPFARRMAVAPMLLADPSVCRGGSFHDVPNPSCRFPSNPAL
jgi:transcriptional regulator with XRE-family HTH domain